MIFRLRCASLKVSLTLFFLRVIWLLIGGVIGLKHKVENQGQYEEYLKELEPIRQELGISLQEHMYPHM